MQNALMGGQGERWMVLNSGAADAGENMAIDEALLDGVSKIGCPVLRFYEWSAPAASFGYSQKYEEVSTWTNVRPLVRRPTGGGLVLHGSDWTYSLMIPREHGWYRLGASESYCRMHAWIRSAFESIGVTTELAVQPSTGLAGQCFARAEPSDLLCAGRKIAGAAQRRSRTGLLIQGSVHPEGLDGVAQEAWREAMKRNAPAVGPVEWGEWTIGQEMMGKIDRLLHDKYLNGEYHRRR